MALLFALGPLAIFFVSKGLQHASNPLVNRPAGGLAVFVGAVNVLALILGPLAAILIGVQAGVADVDAGVFRDLVATGGGHAGSSSPSGSPRRSPRSCRFW